MRYNKASETMLRKARQKYTLAEISFEKGLYDSCISELYYSAFQTVTALILLRDEPVSNKHTYVRTWVNKQLGLTGLLPTDLVKMYNRLMDFRSDADFNAEISFGREEVSNLLTQVQDFNYAVISIINQEMCHKNKDNDYPTKALRPRFLQGNASRRALCQLRIPVQSDQAIRRSHG